MKFATIPVVALSMWVIFTPKEAFSQIKPGQQTENHIINHEKYEYDLLWSELSGVIQFKIFNTAQKPLMSLGLLKELNSARKESEVVVFDYDEYTKITILPKQTSEFFAEDELYQFITTH